MLCAALSPLSCIQSYTPPAIKGTHTYLVVDGFINSGPDSTIFNLSNSTSLGDSLPPAPETGAQITIEGNGGFSSSLTELGNGRYGAPALFLDPSQQYRVAIQTVNGNQYLSTYVPVQQTPAIDSVSWVQQPTGVQIYVSTHDPNNLVNDYEWQYAESYEYHSAFNSALTVVNGAIEYRLANQSIYDCWVNTNSTDIFVGSSAGLSQKVIFEQPILFIPTSSVKLSVEYSILVKQLALTPDAYAFWQNLKANTQELGSILGPLPSEVAGNIQCVNDPALPVLGYISAGNLQQSRIFIFNDQISNWPYYYYCTDSLIYAGAYYPHFYNLGYLPFQPVGAFQVLIAWASCSDCRLIGPGDTSKPAFWR
jgi:hypothetical protein